LHGGPDPWQAVAAFVTAARLAGAAGLLCVRFGNNNEGGFGVIDWSKSKRVDDLGVYAPEIVITESYFDPSVL
ncbi:MAG: hypothetical protein ACRDU0_01535, partial [Mycobacterium sp.]